ncbi:AI-2E family transporter [Arundinibacter roseus]|uniref:AI-2E family transporter n=1 Tax=Arundinibacter roseus TaxID=2070510 RepID=A0A4R4KJL3_9BACT|nr:AI-2E family transporter [Arundinibacter roseus]TDB68153.1 AI-2E family transporter [Arundinibacter roseus]
MKEKLTIFSRGIIIMVGIPAALYLGKAFLVTFCIGVILALVLNPVMDWLMAKGFRKSLAVAASTFLLVLFFVGLAGLLWYQVSLVSQDWPQIQERSEKMLTQAQEYVAEQTGVSPDKQISKAKDSVSKLSSQAAGFFGSFTSTLANFLLVFVYVVLLLSQRHRVKKFLLMVSPDHKKGPVNKMMAEVCKTASSYVWGMLKVITALAIVYAIGFSIGGVKYSILLAILAALFSFLPYVGNVIGGGLAALLAVVSGEPSSFFIVAGVMIVAQLLENYVLSPFVVGDSVQLNPFFSIVSIIVFSTIWGLGGAIIAIPLTAIIRVLFKLSVHTQPLVYLMSDDSDD